MNGHIRRAMDVISRLSKSTIDFLSFYIGFGSYCRGKMVVLDETMDLYEFLSKNWICFRFFILIWASFGDVLGIENQLFRSKNRNFIKK